MWPVWILISLRREPAHLSFMASTNAVLATVYLLVTYSVCVCVCVCEAVYVITIFLTKSMSTKAVRTSAMQQKQLVTGLGHKPKGHRKSNSHKASVHTDDHSGDTNPANMHQTSLTEISMLVSDWWIRLCHRAPHSTHKAQHIHTSHTCITLLYPTNTIKIVDHL